MLGSGHPVSTEIIDLYITEFSAPGTPPRRYSGQRHIPAGRSQTCSVFEGNEFVPEDPRCVISRTYRIQSQWFGIKPIFNYFSGLDERIRCALAYDFRCRYCANPVLIRRFTRPPVIAEALGKVPFQFRKRLKCTVEKDCRLIIATDNSTRAG